MRDAGLRLVNDLIGQLSGAKRRGKATELLAHGTLAGLGIAADRQKIEGAASMRNRCGRPTPSKTPETRRSQLDDCAASIDYLAFRVGARRSGCRPSA
jgi:hypothetical protein